MQQDGSGNNTDGRQPDNVVRLPAEWVGPLDELVPMGHAESASPGVSPAADAPPLADAPLSADDFWSESSAAMHLAVDSGRRHPPCPPSRAPLAPTEPVEIAPKDFLGRAGADALLDADDAMPGARLPARLGPRLRYGLAVGVQDARKMMRTIASRTSSGPGSVLSYARFEAGVRRPMLLVLLTAALSALLAFTLVSANEPHHRRMHTPVLRATASPAAQPPQIKFIPIAPLIIDHRPRATRERHVSARKTPNVASTARPASTTSTPTSRYASTASTASTRQVAETPSSNHSQSTSSSRPAFGAQGALGPGSSPDG